MKCSLLNTSIRQSSPQLYCKGIHHLTSTRRKADKVSLVIQPKDLKYHRILQDNKAGLLVYSSLGLCCKMVTSLLRSLFIMDSAVLIVIHKRFTWKFPLLRKGHVFFLNEGTICSTIQHVQR